MVLASVLALLTEPVYTALLAVAVEEDVSVCYKVILPQNIEDPGKRDVAARDKNIETFIACDAIACVFNGTEIDSGAVVEYMLVKFLDMPPSCCGPTSATQASSRRRETPGT